MTTTISEIFADVFLTTGPLVATKKDKVVNEITRRTYWLNYVLKGFANSGGTMMDMFNGGEKIQDTILLDEFNTFQRYDPDDEFTYPSGENLTNWEIPYRYAKAHLKFTKHEAKHNEGGRGSQGMFQQYKRLFRTKEQNFWTNVCNSLEDEWFQIPTNAEMEDQAGKEPYSLACFVNDYVGGTTAGEQTNGITTAGLPPGFTTIQQINPATKTKWQPQQAFYTDAPVSNAWTGWRSMSRLYKRLEFHRLPKQEEMGEGMTMPAGIFTSEEGCTYYEIALVTANDPLSSATASKGDGAIAGPLMYKGNVPLYHLESLTSAVHYRDAVAAGTVTGGNTGSGGGAPAGGTGSSDFIPEFTDSVDFDGNTLAGSTVSVGNTNYTVGTPVNRSGPRFYFLDNRYLRTFMPEGEMFETVKVKPTRQPHSTVLVTDIWNNNFVRSRRRLGCLIPGAPLQRV